MKTKPLTDKQYVASAGQKCPNCHKAEDNVQAEGQAEMDGNIGYQGCSCSECGATWTDIIEVTGYDNLFVPDNKD